MRELLAVILVSAVLCCVSSCEDRLDVQADVLLDFQQVGYEAGSQNISVQASGKWTLTLFFPDGEPWAEINVTRGSGSKDGIVLSYGENKDAKSRTCRIILTNKGSDAVRNFVQTSKNESEMEAKGVPMWLELPVIGEGLSYYNHHFKYNGKDERNYSFAYDEDALISHWVAYPLCKFHIDGSDPVKNNQWEYNPKVKEEQPEMFNSFDGGRVYERGHQIPNADRYVTAEANQQTYYFTNMTPQHKSFNAPTWSEIESKVRNYTFKADTIYVVTGCTLGNSTAANRKGQNVNIPAGYFKALLRYSKASNVYSAAGVFMEHKSSYPVSIDWSLYFMSIDELENKVGIDFFPNLESRIGQKAAAEVEAEDPHTVSFWGI